MESKLSKIVTEQGKDRSKLKVIEEAKITADCLKQEQLDVKERASKIR